MSDSAAMSGSGLAVFGMFALLSVVLPYWSVVVVDDVVDVEVLLGVVLLVWSVDEVVDELVVDDVVVGGEVFDGVVVFMSVVVVGLLDGVEL